MAYSVYTDVASEFKGIVFSSSSPVTDTEITEFISQGDAYLDSRLAGKYETPITGTEALKVMKRLSIWYVTARVKEILDVKLPQTTGEQRLVSPDLFKRVEDELKRILKGEILLTDATLSSSNDGVNAFSIDEGLEFEFSATDDNW